MKGILGYINKINYSGPEESIDISNPNTFSTGSIAFKDLPLALQLFLQIEKPDSIHIEFELNESNDFITHSFQIDTEDELYDNYLDFQNYLSTCESLQEINETIINHLGQSQSIKKKISNYENSIESHKPLREHLNPNVINHNQGCQFTVENLEDWLALYPTLNKPKSRPCDIIFNIWDGAQANIAMIRAIQYQDDKDPNPTRVISPFADKDRSWNNMAEYLSDLAKKLDSILIYDDWDSTFADTNSSVNKIGNQVLATMMLYILDGRGNEVKKILNKTAPSLFKEDFKNESETLFAEKQFQELEAGITEFFTLTFGIETKRNLFCATDTLIHLNNIAMGEYNFYAAFSRNGKSLMTGSKGFNNLGDFLNLDQKPLIDLYTKLKNNNNKIDEYTACARAYKALENLLNKQDIKPTKLIAHHLSTMMSPQDMSSSNLETPSKALPVISNLRQVPFEVMLRHALKQDVSDFLNSIKESKIDDLNKYLKIFTDVNNFYQNTLPLQLAIDNNNIDIVNILLDHGADPSKLNKTGENLIQYALTKSETSPEIIHWLIQAQIEQQKTLLSKSTTNTLPLQDWGIKDIEINNNRLTNDDINYLMPDYPLEYNCSLIKPVDVRHNWWDITGQILNSIDQQLNSGYQLSQFTICPINFGNSHWASMVIEMTSNITAPNIYFFDSLGSTNKKMQIIDKIIKDTQIFRNANLVDLSTNKLIQQSGHSCGTWMLESIKAVLQVRGGDNPKTIPESVDDIQKILQNINMKNIHQENLSTVRGVNTD